jgi:hypothetical protein
MLRKNHKKLKKSYCNILSVSYKQLQLTKTFKMSTETVNNIETVVEKKVRAPSLPAKYNKFIQFAYYLLDGVNKDGVVIEPSVFFDKIHLFDNVQGQQAFVQSFFDNSKDTGKTIRKLVAQHKKDIIKANKPIKDKKIRQKKTTTTTDSSTPNNDNKNKKTRSKKSTIEDSLVNQLVNLANNGPELDNVSVSILEFNNVKYLIDDNANVYDFTSHDIIGKFVDNQLKLN